MAGLLAIFAQFEREILRERVKAGTLLLDSRVVACEDDVY